MSYALEINWLRCPDGYRIAMLGEILHGDKWVLTGLGDLARGLTQWAIAPKTARRVACQPMRRDNDRLYLAFANLRNPDSIVGFANQHGLLGLDAAASNPADPPYELIEGPPGAWHEKGGRDSWGSAIHRMFVEVAALTAGPWPYTLPDDDEPLGMMKGVLRRTDAGMALAFRPVTLLDALRLQFGMRAAQGISVAKCEQCGTPFETGASSRRRSTSRFCSPTCRYTHHNRRRSQGEGK